VAAKPLKGTDFGQALQEFLLDRADRKEALIYFSGHGFTVSDNLRRKKGYLATSDCTAATIATCGIPLDSLNQLIAESNLSSLVVLLDCCHAGSLLEINLVRQSLTAFNSSQKDYYLIAACRDFESAWEGEQHSVFTEALLKGLREENKGSDGKVSCDRVFAVIDEELKRSGQEPIRMGWGRSITLVQYQPKKTEVVVDETCPYQGLQPFGKEQARFFFGREKVVLLLMEKLEQANFVPIIGASGSGKSSVVRAGLIPQLEKSGWRVLEPILPGDEPLAELKTVLIELFGRTEGREVYSLIKTDGLRPVNAKLSGSERLLLVVDQFEEVFTVCPNEEERRQFIELLTQVAEIPASPLAIVTTMRADFVAPCLSYESLTKLIQDEAVYMPPLVGAQLEEAIASPANIQGYQLETGLLGAILQDLGQEKECLPLLQFALTELWEKRDRQKHQLTVEQYGVLEGVSGALNRHTQKIYTYKDFLKESPQQERSPQEREWIKRIFLKLVRTGEGVKDTRQRQPKAKLLAVAPDKSVDEEAISKVLDELIQEGRLLVAGQENRQEEAWIDLAHEALMEGWQRFAQWRQETRELRRLSDRVEDALREWQKNPRDENLMMGGLLAQVQEKWLELEPYLEVEAREFYQQSDERLRAEEALRQAQESLYGLIENATEGIFQVTPSGRYLSANPSLARIYGFSSPEELINSVANIWKQFYVDPIRRDDIVALLQGQVTLSDLQSQVYRKDGSIIWISENIRSVRDANGTLLYYQGSVNDITERKQSEIALRLARKRAELLLLNFFPQPVAERLKRGQRIVAESVEEVTVLFADLVDFTKLSAQTSPTELVEILHVIFSQFDRLARHHCIEKIKTINTAYMVAAGLSKPRSDHAQAIAQMALDMQAVIVQLSTELGKTFRLRVGINSGLVVAGVIGINKSSYDLWGDTVNIASRMESQGLPDCIQVSAATYERLRDQYLFKERGEIDINGNEKIMTYLLIGRREK
jgi:PAS domain S-box-containing protein